MSIARLKKGKKKFQTRIYVGHRPDGSPILKSKSFDRLKEAQEHHAKFTAFKKNQIDKTVSDKTLFGAVFLTYLLKIATTKKDNTVRNYRSTFKKWIEPHLGDIPVGDIGEMMLGRFFNEIRSEGASEYVVNYTHILLNEIFKHAASSTQQYIQENPLNKITKAKLEYNPTNTIKFWSKKEAEKILDAAIGSEYYLVITLMLNTGIRVSEMAATRESSFDLANKILNVTNQISPYEPKSNELKYDLEEVYVLGPTKNRATRSIPLNKNALDVAKLAIQKNNSENFFLFSPDRKSKEYKVIIKRGASPQFISTKLISARTLGNALRRFSEQTGVPYIGPHGLRHTFAANFLMNGGDLFTLSRILGHKNISSTQIYLHLTSGYLKSAMNIVEFGG